MLILKTTYLMFLANNIANLLVFYYIYINKNVHKLYAKLLIKIYDFKFKIFYDNINILREDGSYNKTFYYKSLMQKNKLVKKEWKEKIKLFYLIKIYKYYWKYFDVFKDEWVINFSNLVIKNLKSENFIHRHNTPDYLYFKYFIFCKKLPLNLAYSSNTKIITYFKYQNYKIYKYFFIKILTFIKKARFLTKFVIPEKKKKI